MAFELEALVGHLYVVAGRNIKTSPPGALVEVAPRRAARGREADTYFTLVLPSGTLAPTTFYAQMAAMSAERYFSATGSVTSVLREMFNTLNHNLYEHNQSGRSVYEANMITAVLRGDELYLARAGASVAILRYEDGKTVAFPEDVMDDEALYIPPLGVQPIPEVNMKRYKLRQGVRLLLVDASIAEIAPERRDEALGAATLEAVLDDYKALITLQTQMLGVEFVPPEEQVPVPVVAGESTVQISEEIAAAKQRIQVRQAEEDAKKPRRERRESKAQHQLKRSTGSFANGAGHGFLAIGQLLEKLTLGDNETSPRKRFSRGALTTSVIAFPLIMVVVVVLSWVGGVGATAFETCVNESVDTADVARSINSSSPQNVISAWQATLRKIEQCETMRPGDPVIAEIRREGRLVIDTLNNIKRRDAQVVATFPGASLSDVVLQGLDVYVLDGANSHVHRIQLTGDGRGAQSKQIITNMVRGATVDGYQLGTIIDIAFDIAETNLVAVDENGVVVRCPPSFIMQCSAERVLNSEAWQNPLAITIWERNLYILDVGAGQIWRYEPTSGRYLSAPDEYFTDGSPNLARAVDFDISLTGTTRGSVYVLFEDGIMARYYQGQRESFGFDGFPAGQELSEQNTLQALFMDDSPIFPAFYLASRPSRTLYVTSLVGTYFDSYRVFEEDKFELLADLAVDSSQRLMYVVSGNAVFVLNMDAP